MELMMTSLLKRGLSQLRSNGALFNKTFIRSKGKVTCTMQNLESSSSTLRYISQDVTPISRGICLDKLGLMNRTVWQSRTISQIAPMTSVHHFHTSRPCCILEDRQTKALTVWRNLGELRASPLPALTLGLSGLIPYVAAPVYMITAGAYMPEIAFAQVCYGASILSFLGGVRWGFTLPEENPVQPDWKNLTYSVVPSLIAWTGLLMPAPWSLFTVMSGLLLTAYYDMAMYGYPPWFKGLRFLLSFVAVLSLWTTFMCSFMLNSEKAKSEQPPTDSQ